MPDVVRTVSTLLKIDGEQQYKAIIKNIRSENDALKASIRLVDEQFKGQANTMAALVAKEKLFTDQQALSKQRLSETQSMFAKSQAAVKKYTDEIAKLQSYVAKDADEQKKLDKQMQTAQENLAKAQNSVVFYSKSVTNAEIEVAKINRALKDNAQYLNEAKNSANGTATSIDGYGKQVKIAKENTEELGKNGAEAFNNLAQALVTAGLIKSVGELVGLFKDAVGASNDFETAFTGVTKTVEGSPEQLAAIKEQMKALSTEIPLTAVELSKIATIAGQLGIATDDISSFTETVAALTVSTNLNAEQAATQLARFAKITGMQASEYDNLGAVIVALGNNSAATESEIVDMGMGIAAAGKQVGMSQAQIMAYAAALTSAGMDSQAGGTAISRTLVEMSMAAETGGESLDKFASIAGMSSEAFASLFKTSASDALNAFITGLASGSESAIKALNDMGITEIRQRDAILRLANAGDTLTGSINTANTAFAENTALTEEAAKFYGTTDSKIQLLKNSVNLLAITVGDQLNPKVREAVETGTNVIDTINEYLQQNPAAIQAVTGLAASLATMAAAISGVSIAFNIVIPAIKAFQTAIGAASAGSVMLGIAVASLAVGLIAAAAASKESTKEFEEQAEASKEITQAIEQSKKAYDDSLKSIESQRRGTNALVDELYKLSDGYTGSSAEQAKMQKIVDDLNSSMDGLNLSFDKNTGAISQNADAIKNRAQALYDSAKQEADAQRYTQLLKDQADAEYAASVARDAYLSAGGKASASDLLKLNKNWKDAKETLSGVNAELSDFEGKAQAAAEASDSAAESMSTNTDSADNLAASLTAMQTAWTESRDSALDSAEKIAGVLDTLDGKGKTTIDKITESQEQQKQFWIDYADNLAKAKELGLDPNLLAQLSEPTEENAQLLDSIVKGSVEKVKELNQAYEDNAQARADFASASASAKTEITDLYKNLTNDMATFMEGMDMSDVGYANGAASILSLLGGMESQLPDFYALLAQVWAEIAKINNAKITLPGSGGLTNDKGVYLFKGHADGLDTVPYDDYLARLHKGESVLTAKEAVTWRALKASIISSTPSAAALTAMPRQASTQDISNAVGSAMSSVKSGNSYVFQPNIYSPKTLNPYELAREERRMIRNVVRNSQ